MGHSHIPEEKKQAIRKFKSEFPHTTYRAISEKFNVCKVSVYNILNSVHTSSIKKPVAEPKSRIPKPRVTDPSLLRRLTAGRA